MERLREFSERLKELFDLSGKTVSEVADKISVTGSGIYGYLSGDHIPNLDHAERLANYFDCSLDFLFGFTESKEKRRIFSEKTMPKRLERAIKESGKSKYALAKEHEFDQSQLYRWCHGLSFPSLANLVKLAEALGCSLDDLAGFSTEP